MKNDRTNLVLQSLHLLHFKQHRDRKVEFNPDVTIIQGDNETGKSTFFDGFMWLFFGKDSHNTADTKFSIKTIDPKTEKVIQRLDHSVEGVFTINGDKTTARRVLKEKWEKKKGATQKTYTGNKTEYYWNEVPLSKRDYEAKINQFISENVFKMITDTHAFNNLNWEKQRSILNELGDTFSDSEIAKGNKDFESLMDKLTNKSFEEYKKQIKNTLKRLKDDKQGIPARIDELLRDKPDEIDFNAIEKEIKKLQKELSEIDDKIADKNKLADDLHKEYQSLRDNISELKSKKQDIELKTKRETQEEIDAIKDPSLEINQNIKKVQADIDKYKDAIDRLESSISSDKSELQTVIDKKEVKSKEWEAENSKELSFDGNNFNCPTCGRELEKEDIEEQKQEMRDDFIENQRKAKEQINSQGIALKEQQESLEEIIAKNEKRIADGKKSLKEKEVELEKLNTELEKVSKNPVDKPDVEDYTQKRLDANADYQSILKDIEVTNEKLSNQKSIDVSDLKEERSSLLERMDEEKSKLNAKAEITRIDNRVAELEREEEENARQIANTERELFTIKEFEVARMTAIEDSVNNRFEKVRFKMFSELVDGTKVPDCICTYKGVPFSDVNTAGQIEAGLDIINALCEFYDVTVPIFIDSAEGITDIPETKSQQIQLEVKKGINPFKVN